MPFRTQRGNLLTVSERKTRFVLTAPLKTKTAEETDQALRLLPRHVPETARRTITFDNGGEFAHHHVLSHDLRMRAYFCAPHSPWQRGSIEITNGILRRDMSRKTNLTDYNANDIDELTCTVNSTPRKCLGFKTPAEAFFENIKRCT